MTIEMTLAISEPMMGKGFIGIGWGTDTMNDAEMWFCQVSSSVSNRTVFFDVSSLLLFLFLTPIEAVMLCRDGVD